MLTGSFFSFFFSNSRQTETGWPCISNLTPADSPSQSPLYPIKPGSATKPLAGYKLHILDDEGKEITTAKTQGNLALSLPLPPGAFLSLWKSPERYMKSYFSRFPHYYDTSDSGYIDEDGYVFIMARTDDVLNVAGHRLSSGALEEVLARHRDIAEAAVVAKHDEIKGSLPVGFVVLKTSSSYQISTNPANSDTLKKELIAAVRQDIGAIAAFHLVYIVNRLPKTRSGKIIRNVLRTLVDKQEVRIPATIEDITVIQELTTSIEKQDSKQ